MGFFDFGCGMGVGLGSLLYGGEIDLLDFPYPPIGDELDTG